MDRLIAASGVDAVGVYAGSGTLARQIAQGAPADVFVTAHPEWMSYLEANVPLPQTPRIIASNALVWIAREAGEGPIYARALSTPRARIAVADPDSVPAGRYARAALEAMAQWEEAAERAVFGAHVRDVLRWVALGHADFGIVYATDARLYPDLTAEPLPEEVQPRILYLAVAVEDTPEARDFVEFLSGEAASRIMAEAGFRAPPSEVELQTGG